MSESNGAPLAGLAETLGQLLPTLARMRELLGEQREAVAASDLQRFMLLTEKQEALTARLAQIERRRQTLQQAAEQVLGVSGLPEIARVAPCDEATRRQFEALLDQLGQQVTGLGVENSRTATLLSSTIEATRRARAHLARLAGSQPTYGPQTHGPHPATMRETA